MSAPGTQQALEAPPTALNEERIFTTVIAIDNALLTFPCVNRQGAGQLFRNGISKSEGRGNGSGFCLMMPCRSIIVRYPTGVKSCQS